MNAERSGGTDVAEGRSANQPDKKERMRRWLIVLGTVILAIFLVYLLLILINPSMDIGMSP